MPAVKNDIYLLIKVRDESVAIGGVRMLDGKIKVKRGRSWARRVPVATLTQLFAEGRKWAAKRI
jgi:hypothetical protein